MSLQMSVMDKEERTSHALNHLHKPMGATLSHRNPHLLMDTGKHGAFTQARHSFSFGLSRTSAEVVWMLKGLNEMINQCHEPSSTLLIHLSLQQHPPYGWGFAG